jgi:uncharacterized protein (DUF1697 family)
MRTFISMLRGINVSGQKNIRMAELKSLYQSLGLLNVETYVQSGNVIFESAERNVSKLAALIEAQIAQSFGYAVSVFIRDTKDFQRIVTGNPFLTERDEDPTKLHVTFLYGLPSKSQLRNLDVPKDTTDEFVVKGKEIFLYCPNGYGRTKLSNNFFEKKLGMPATTRNWKTVNALHQMANER